MGKLVLYFSEFGNTESIARRIAEKTGADICKIEPIEPYPENLQEVMEIGQNETDTRLCGQSSSLKSICQSMTR